MPSTESIDSGSCPTQEDKLRAKEADAEELEKAEEVKFLERFRTIPKKIVKNYFNNQEALLTLSIV